MKIEQGKVYKIINSFLYCYQTNKVDRNFGESIKNLNKGDSFIFLGLDFIFLGLEKIQLLKLLHKGKVIYFPYCNEKDFPDWFEELNDDNR